MAGPSKLPLEVGAFLTLLLRPHISNLCHLGSSKSLAGASAQFATATAHLPASMTSCCPDCSLATGTFLDIT